MARDMKIITATNQEVVPVHSRVNHNNVVLVVRNGQVGWMTVTGLSEQGAQVATPNSTKVLVDGKAVAFDAYTIGLRRYVAATDSYMEALAPANGNLTLTDAGNGTRDFFVLPAN